VAYPLYAFGLATALLTAFYSSRIIFPHDLGNCSDTTSHQVPVHDSPNNMLAPLMILAVS